MKRIFSSVLFAASIAHANSVDLQKTSNRVEFLAVGNPSALKIKGKLKAESKVQGTFALKDHKVNGSATLDLKDLDTGMELRNSHMKDNYLEIAKFPTAVLTLKDVPFDHKLPSTPFTGTLKLHGVEKPVSGTMQVTETADKYNCKFDFSLELSDFDIQVPKYLGITVSKNVKVEAEFKQ